MPNYIDWYWRRVTPIGAWRAGDRKRAVVLFIIAYAGNIAIYFGLVKWLERQEEKEFAEFLEEREAYKQRRNQEDFDLYYSLAKRGEAVRAAYDAHVNAIAKEGS